MSESELSSLTEDDHRQAFTEVSFLLDIFASTIDDVMGGSTATVGRIAGRKMARKLPIYMQRPSPSEALAAFSEYMKAGFDISHNQREGALEIAFGRCAIRDVCVDRGIPTGGSLCRLFHEFTDGVINELSSHPTKGAILRSGETCVARMDTR
jgi:hypothetical protein